MLNKQHLIFSIFLQTGEVTVSVCAHIFVCVCVWCVSGCVRAAFLSPEGLEAYLRCDRKAQILPSTGIVELQFVRKKSPRLQGEQVTLRNMEHNLKRWLGPVIALYYSKLSLPARITDCKAFCVCMPLCVLLLMLE